MPPSPLSWRTDGLREVYKEPNSSIYNITPMRKPCHRGRVQSDKRKAGKSEMICGLEDFLPALTTPPRTSLHVSLRTLVGKFLKGGKYCEPWHPHLQFQQKLPTTLQSESINPALSAKQKKRLIVQKPHYHYRLPSHELFFQLWARSQHKVMTGREQTRHALPANRKRSSDEA